MVVALNPDRYEGDWWTTSPTEALAQGNPEELRWYGTDNFFLRHPVLTSLVMGMFRQAFLLHEQGFGDAILKVVNRREVEECLTYGDPDLAIRILNKLRPWIAVPTNRPASPYPFPTAYWHRLGQLKKAIYRYGYNEVFGGDIREGWGLGESGGGRYGIYNGPLAYWGATGSKITLAGKRLAQLGK